MLHGADAAGQPAAARPAGKACKALGQRPEARALWSQRGGRGGWRTIEHVRSLLDGVRGGGGARDVAILGPAFYPL